MVLPLETIHRGASNICPDCKTKLKMEVLHNENMVYYVGTQCKCGPYSRETEYFNTREQATDALKNGTGLR